MIMKLRYILCSIGLAILATACNKEDDLSSVVDFKTPYVLDNNSNDPIDQERYRLFTEYGVPVFFKDTLTVTEIGKDYAGEPIYRYETLDISWEFTQRNASNYKFTYLETQEEKEAALKYVETYLKQASKKMRPFSIMLLKDLKVDGENKEFVDGMRTLFIGQADIYSDEEEMITSSKNMISSMVLEKVKLEDDLKTRFEYVSDADHYYDTFWSNLGVTFSVNVQCLTSSMWRLRLENAFDQELLESWVYDYMLSYAPYMGYPGVNLYGNLPGILAARDELVAAAAQFGFICGDPAYSHMRGPKKDLDLKTFVSTMLELGTEKFTERYGNFPLVMQKFNMLKEFISEELGVDLNF